MDDINNLDDLKKVASNDVIMKCFTEFFMEIYGEYNSHDKNFICNYQVKKGNITIAEFTNKEDALLFIEVYQNQDKRTKCKLIENTYNLPEKLAISDIISSTNSSLTSFSSFLSLTTTI